MRTFRPCKRFLTSLILFFLFTAGYSQTVIPNGDFEIWVSHTGYNDPQGWSNPDSEKDILSSSSSSRKSSDNFLRGAA